MFSRIAICSATLVSPAMLLADGHDTLSEALPDRFIAYVFEEARRERRRGDETGVISVTIFERPVCADCGWIGDAVPFGERSDDEMEKFIVRECAQS
ncbi:MAG: hypothetical protein ABJ327_11860 [Litoreibacter sp.]